MSSTESEPLSLFVDQAQSFVLQLSQYEQEFIALRRAFHQYPELSAVEFKTSERIAGLLAQWGYKVTRDIAGTGLVGTLQKGSSTRSIGLRADMDALPIQELTQLPYASQNTEVMHACGHDGHMAMLLLAAKYLALHGCFDGQLVLIFQPDEEQNAGAKRMVEQGLFSRFPVDSVYAMHNFPNAPVGQLMMREGAVMAGTVTFSIVVEGIGAHAAHPYLGVDPILVASHIVLALQSVVSRNINPLQALVITVAAIAAGKADNVIPQTATLSGTMRYFDHTLRDFAEQRLTMLAQQTAMAYGATAQVHLKRGYIPTINHPHPVVVCEHVARSLVHADQVFLEKMPSMGAEDFAYMLAERPGCYLYIGNGSGAAGCTLHNPNYDFNDRNVLIGGAFWARLVEHVLPVL